VPIIFLQSKLHVGTCSVKSSSSLSFYCNKGVTERKPTNDKLIIQTNNSYDVTYGLKKYSRKDVWSEQVAGKSVYTLSETITLLCSGQWRQK